ncbi:Hypothetical predicted protein [Mytilus galloprovincialis]|uniref:Uncharacterized protein n=1 Tax=Mytilus galloprovincialis TaxID=29158 RepID=A0A8B6FLN1_MYTGA|nr:Hypothetical predicted protein [Mytilus galloprovincialis]
MAITNIQTTKYSTGRDWDEDDLAKLLPDNATTRSEIDKCEYNVNKVFLYTMCTGSMALFMVLASYTLTFYRREKSRGKNSQKEKQDGNNKGRPTLIIV